MPFHKNFGLYLEEALNHFAILDVVLSLIVIFSISAIVLVIHLLYDLVELILNHAFG